MRIKNTYQNRKILFKRWTRTPWAVFTSLKIVVHNHCTKISSFKDSLLKQQGTNRSESVSLSDEIDTVSELAAMEVPWDDELLIKLPVSKILAIKAIVIKEVATILLSNYHIIPADKFNVGRDFFIPYFI